MLRTRTPATPSPGSTAECGRLPSPAACCTPPCLARPDALSHRLLSCLQQTRLSSSSCVYITTCSSSPSCFACAVFLHLPSCPTLCPHQCCVVTASPQTSCCSHTLVTRAHVLPSPAAHLIHQRTVHYHMIPIPNRTHRAASQPRLSSTPSHHLHHIKTCSSLIKAPQFHPQPSKHAHLDRTNSPANRSTISSIQ